MQRFKRFLFALSGALVFSSMFSCSNSMQEIKAISFVDTFPVETGKNVEIVYSDSARIQAIVKAPVYRRYLGKDPYLEMPDGIDVTFYDSAMNVSMHMTSKYAIKYDKKNVMEAKHDVVVINAAGEKLNTQHLIWNEQTRRIYTNVFVRITQKDKVLLGDGLDADDSFSKWIIPKPRGTFYINTDEETGEETEIAE